MNYNFGPVALGGNVPVFMQTLNGSGVVTAPDSAPTFSVYEADQDSPLANSSNQPMTQTNAQTGFYRNSFAIPSSNGYAAGAAYCVRFSYLIATVPYVQLGWFTVV